MDDDLVWTLYYRPEPGRFRPVYSHTFFSMVEIFMNGALYAHCREAGLDSSRVSRGPNVDGGHYVMVHSAQGVLMACYEITQESQEVEEQGDRGRSGLRNSHGDSREVEHIGRRPMLDSTNERRPTERPRPADSRRGPANESADSTAPRHVHDYRRPETERDNASSGNPRGLGLSASRLNQHQRQQPYSAIMDEGGRRNSIDIISGPFRGRGLDFDLETWAQQHEPPVLETYRTGGTDVVDILSGPLRGFGIHFDVERALRRDDQRASRSRHNLRNSRSGRIVEMSDDPVRGQGANDEDSEG